MPLPSTISITYNGTEISQHVLYKDSTFECNASAQVGTFALKVRDMSRTLSFVTGKEVVLTVDGVTLFGGFVTSVTKTFAFPVVDTSVVANVQERIFILRGVDYNIWFDKRVFWNPADPTAELTAWSAGTTDQSAIQTLVSTYLTTPPGLDYTTLVESVGYAAATADQTGTYGTYGDSWRKVMEDITAASGSMYYINGSKQLVNKAYEDAESRWGFSDVPNYRPLAGAEQRFQGTFIGPRDLDITENATHIVNDALVWGGSRTAGTDDMGDVVFARAQNSTSITDHSRWQMAEIQVNNPNYLSEAQVQVRADNIVNGLSGADERGVSRGLGEPQWNVSLSWFSHDVPLLGGNRDHIIPGQLVTMYWFSLGSSLSNPLFTVLPLRSVRINFVLTDQGGGAYVRFDGTFSLSPTDPWGLWNYLRNSRSRLSGFVSAATVTTSSASAQGALTPSPDGSTTVFTAPSGYVSSTTQVTINGLVQRRGIDYTETDALAGTVTFASAPQSGDTLWIVYQAV